jgi:4-hydroxybenzoyl-CoA thioesterase
MTADRAQAKSEQGAGKTYTNRRQITIYWGDCDPAGIVFNPRLFEIFDASTALIFEAALGINKREMLTKFNAAGIPLVKTEAEFLKPLRYGDHAVVESTVTFGRTSFGVEHKILCDDQLHVKGVEKRVWTARDANGQMRSAPIPQEILAACGITSA